MDPPYLSETRSKKHAYKHDWCEEDHKKFLDLIPDLKGKFVISGYASDLYSNFLSKMDGLTIVSFKAISQGSSRDEVLWIKK